MPRFVVMVAQAKMPTKCFAAYNYRKVAVVETDGVNMPKQIHPSHKSVVSIPFIRDRLFKGKTKKSAFWIEYAKAVALAEKLNAA